VTISHDPEPVGLGQPLRGTTRSDSALSCRKLDAVPMQAARGLEGLGLPARRQRDSGGRCREWSGVILVPASSPPLGPRNSHASQGGGGSGGAVGAMVAASHAMPHDLQQARGIDLRLRATRKTMAPQSLSIGFLRRPHEAAVKWGPSRRSSLRWKPEMVPLRCDGESSCRVPPLEKTIPLAVPPDATSRMPPLIWVATAVPPLLTSS
jgi:hypothetical protein